MAPPTLVIVYAGLSGQEGNTRAFHDRGQSTSSKAGGGDRGSGSDRGSGGRAGVDREGGGCIVATSVSSRAQRVGVNKSGTTAKMKGSAVRIGSGPQKGSVLGIGSGPQKGSGGVMVRQAKATSRQSQRLRHQT